MRSVSSVMEISPVWASGVSVRVSMKLVLSRPITVALRMSEILK